MGIILNSTVAERSKQAENEVKEALETLGRKYYEDNKDNANDKYSDDLTNIISLEDKAIRWKQYYLKSEDKRLCEKCKAIVPSDSLFCNKCGKSLEQLDFSEIESLLHPDLQSQQESQPMEVNVCPSCGKPLVEGAVFCEKCGAKIS